MTEQPKKRLSPLERMTPEQRAEVIKKAQEARARNRELGKDAPKKKMTPIRAIRLKCVKDCCAGQPSEVKLCTAKDCYLWPYRLGKRPKDIVDAILGNEDINDDDAEELDEEDEGTDDEETGEDDTVIELDL